MSVILLVWQLNLRTTRLTSQSITCTEKSSVETASMPLFISLIKRQGISFKNDYS